MEQKREELEWRLMIIRLITIALCILLLISSSWLAKTVFSYEVEHTKMVEEPYEYVVDRVQTYVCYTTTYGSKYHAAGCSYLWNSAHETTVYQAKNRGYGACSKCTPREQTVYEITEIRYQQVEQIETVTEEPTMAVRVIGLTSIVLIYYISTIWLRKRIRELNN